MGCCKQQSTKNKEINLSCVKIPPVDFKTENSTVDLTENRLLPPINPSSTNNSISDDDSEEIHTPIDQGLQNDHDNTRVIFSNPSPSIGLLSEKK